MHRCPALSLSLLAISFCTFFASFGSTAVAQETSQEVTFSFHSSVESLTDVGQILLGDLNGDGYLDMVTSGSEWGSEWATKQIYVNNGQGNFYFAASYGNRVDEYPVDGYSTYSGASDIALGDVDGDGDLDIVTGGEYVYDDYYCLCYIPTENWIYLNDGEGNFPPDFSYQYGVGSPAASVDIGDMNGDGHLDIITGGASIYDYGCDCYSYDPADPAYDPADPMYDPADPLYDPYCTCATEIANIIYLNDGAGNFADENKRTFGSAFEDLADITLGDFDGDEDIDLMVSGSRIISDLWTSNYYLFKNDGQGNLEDPLQPSVLIDGDPLFDFGDINGDGYLDIVTHIAYVYDEGCNCYSGQHRIALNNGQGEFEEPYAIGSPAESTESMLIGDLDNDGDVDIIATTYFWNEDAFQEFSSVLFINNGAGQFSETPFNLTVEADIYGMDYATAASLIMGDVNNDGAIDLVTSQHVYNDYYELVSSGQIYLNDLGGAANFQFLIEQPEKLSDDEDKRILRIPYALEPRQNSADSSRRVDDLTGSYSIDGGMTWRPARTYTATQTTNLPLGDHEYNWDLSDVGLYGIRDEGVVVKLAANLVPVTQTLTTLAAVDSTHLYTNLIPGPFIWGGADATQASISISKTATISFSQIATQIQVVDEANADVRNAIVYKLDHDQVTGAKPLSAPDGNACRTDAAGQLDCWGELTFGSASHNPDKLVALSYITNTIFVTFTDGITATQGMTFTEEMRIFETSAKPTDRGLEMADALPRDTITLTTSSRHSLILFDLDVSLEWDSSLDGTFEDDLRTAFLRASEVLYDVSDGQIALGNVRIYRNKQNWATSDIVIYANSSLRPRATMGGIVDTELGDIIKPNIEGTLVYTKSVYGPGQIRMGPVWDPFGQSEAELTQEWWRALAHELAHYLLFLPDNYLGMENGMLRTTDCIGSFMTNAHDVNGYSEFLTSDANQWKGDCTKTVAQALTERADWDTITTFYPRMNQPAAGETLAGPHLLPLDVTRVRFAAEDSIAPTAAVDDFSTITDTTVIPARFFDLRGSSGQLLNLAQAQAYLFKTNGTPNDRMDDYVISLGSTGAGSDKIKVRGAETGDQLCIISQDQRFIGCDSSLADSSTSLSVQEMKNWQPAVQVTHANSVTLAVSVTNDLPNALESVTIQILPSQSEEKSAFQVTSPVTTVTTSEGAPNQDTLSAHFDLAHPTFEGFVRVSGSCRDVNDNPAVCESLTHFYLTPAWGPEDRGLSGANRRDWFANRRSFEAPIASGDGKVTIFNVDYILGDTGALSLQAISNPPDVPAWLTPIGPAYRFEAKEEETPKNSNRTIAFHYSQREVPPGYEHMLNIYYLAQGGENRSGENRSGENWRRLPTGPNETGADPHDNLATAIMPLDNEGEGIYALMAAVEMPTLAQGWNILANPLPGANSITTTLASLGSGYSIVYQHVQSENRWLVYDQTFESNHSEDIPNINDLRALEFGHEYWIYATRVVTPYLPISNGNEVVQAASQSGAYSLPPATIVGHFESVSVPDSPPLAGFVNGVQCGTVDALNFGDGAWKLHVASQMMQDGCGIEGQQVVIKAGEQIVAEVPWTNRNITVVGSPNGQTPLKPETPTALPQREEPSPGIMKPVIFIPLFQN